MGIEARQFGERPRRRGAWHRAALGIGAMRQDGKQPRVGLAAEGQQLAPVFGVELDGGVGMVARFSQWLPGEISDMSSCRMRLAAKW